MGIVDEARQREIVDKFMRRLAIKASSPEQKIRELSGGNQQKVLLARWLCTDPKLLILDEPTRGIDVGAKAEIQALIRELADQGLGVLMISSELEEITEGADRVFVLSDGRTVADLSHAEANAGAIMAAMAHGEPEALAEAGHGDAPAIGSKGVSLDVAAFFRRYAALTALIVLLAFNFAVTPHFASWQTLNVNLTQVATIVIVSVGMTLVIATGGIDLSVGSLMAISGALAPMIFMSSFGRSYPALGDVLAFIVPVGVAGLFGLFNGWFITRFQVQPIVGTLVMFIAGRGIGQVLTNGNLQAFKNPAFQFIGLGRIFGVPCQVVIMLALVAAAAWMLRSTCSAATSSRSAATSGRRVCPAFRSPRSNDGSTPSVACAQESPASSSSRSTRRATPISSALAWSSTRSLRWRSAARRSPAGKRPWSARSLARFSSSSCATLCSPTACPTPRRWWSRARSSPAPSGRSSGAGLRERDDGKRGDLRLGRSALPGPRGSAS